MSNQNIKVVQKIICTSIQVNYSTKLFTILWLLIISIHSYSQVKAHKIKRDTTARVGLATVKFKAGTEIIFKDKKIVLEGVLANDIDLNFAARRSVALKAGTKVTFDEKGNVLSGTLQKIKIPICFKQPSNSFRCIEVMPGTQFSLFEDGTLQSGILKNVEGYKTNLNLADILFSNNGMVILRKNGTIQSGFLFNDLFVSSKGLFRSYCYVEFDEKGGIKKGVRNFRINGKIILESINIQNGVIYESKNEHPCLCKL